MVASPAHHACHVYRDPADLITTAAAFLADGLAHGERCWYVGNQRDHSALREALADRGVSLKAADRQGALRIWLPEDVYVPGQAFVPERVMRRFSEAISDALREGFNGFRAAADMAWVGAPEVAPHLHEYEHLITTLLLNSPATGLCLYPESLAHLHYPVNCHPYIATSDAVLHPNAAYTAPPPGPWPMHR